MTTAQELEKLLAESKVEQKAIQEKQAEIGLRIKTLKNRQAEILKAKKATELTLEGFQYQDLVNMVEQILTDYATSDKSYFYEFYGTHNVNVYQMLEDKHFVNELINVMGGKRIKAYYDIVYELSTSTEQKEINRQKTWIKKMNHPRLNKAIEPYLMDLDKVKLVKSKRKW